MFYFWIDVQFWHNVQFLVKCLILDQISKCSIFGYHLFKIYRRALYGEQLKTNLADWFFPPPGCLVTHSLVVLLTLDLVTRGTLVTPGPAPWWAQGNVTTIWCHQGRWQHCFLTGSIISFLVDDFGHLSNLPQLNNAAALAIIDTLKEFKVNYMHINV